ncbi:UNKNOWN [Stylonychia lemnae]|uniref:Uncharacterized protein n=1 Tax=Stylonychia lemnae TaxID=5949 RepID=A0A078B3Y8_STYLE|nr:UNKNOWN [Stylonychia lemnae]|eukprot:CDW88228.1 UNKNOWN [Stylonychia lemnae]
MRIIVAIMALGLIKTDGITQDGSKGLMLYESEGNQLGSLTDVTWSPTMACGQCIDSGYIYCRKGINAQELIQDPFTSDYICCQSKDACPQISDISYTCSNFFGDKLEQKRVCPFVSGRCGQGKKNIVLSKVGEKQTVKISGLDKGQTCMYKVVAKCGVPQFTSESITGVNIDSIELGQDWDSRATIQTEVDSQTSNESASDNNQKPTQEYQRLLTSELEQNDLKVGADLCEDRQMYVVITGDPVKLTSPINLNADFWSQSLNSFRGAQVSFLLLLGIFIFSYYA